MSSRPVKVSIVLILATIVVGVAIRRLPLHLPPLVTKYAGTMLWAHMIYLIVSAVLATWPLLTVAALTAAIATVVECFKLYRAPALDAFRLTLAGSLLLGRIFSLYDIAAYWLAIAIAVVVDVKLRRTNRQRPPA